MSVKTLFFSSYDKLVKLSQKGINGIHKRSTRKRVRKWCETRNPQLLPEQISLTREYWNQYTNKFDINFTRYYTSINGNFDPKYIPDDLYYHVIEPRLNDEYYYPFAHKAYTPLLFDCKKAENIISKQNGVYLDKHFRVISEGEAISLCLDAGSVIVKPSIDTYGGHSIRKVENCHEIKKVFNDFGNNPFIAQKLIKQHQKLSEIHASSVNTIRIMTLLIHNEIHALKPVLRMGVDNKSVDNASSGGLFCGILPDGCLKPYALSVKGAKYDKHPQGYNFENCVVPSIDKAISMVIKQAERFPMFRLIAWDIAIDEDAEPVLVEANLVQGGLEIMQFAHGPIFGDFTDDVLREIFH
jgi:hypothetical protein